MANLKKFHSEEIVAHKKRVKEYSTHLRQVTQELKHTKSDSDRYKLGVMLAHLKPELAHHRELIKKHQNLLCLSGDQ